MVDKILLEVKRLSNKKMENGENIKDILAYRGTSLWWFIESSVYLRLKGIKKVKVPDKKIIIDLVCPLLKTFITIKLLFRSFFGRLFLQRYKNKYSNRKIIVSTSLWNWREVISPITLKRRKGDVILESIVESLENDKFNVLGLSRDDGHLIDAKRFFNKLIHGRDIWRPIEVYLTFDTIGTALKVSKDSEKKWANYLHHLNGEKRELIKSLSGDFKVSFVYHIFQAIMYMEMMKRAIEIEKPKLILLTGEQTDSGRATVHIGKTIGVPILAIQHGFFTSEAHRAFRDLKELSSKVSPQHYPLPDKTAVYGPEIKKLLIVVHNHPPNSTVVTGSPRYDLLSKSNKIFDKKEFCKKFNLGPTKKIVLIITQPLQKMNLAKDREIFFRNVLRVLKKIKDVEIVIKPHPAENEKWHKKILKDEKTKATIVSKDYNIYETLYACDVMVTVCSTTVIEAIILGKPVILVNLTKLPYTEFYVKSGGVLEVRKKEDLPKAINNTLSNKKTLERLKKSRKGFIRRHVYKTNGKATERVVNLIKKMIEK